jgi:hypothetical protein
VTLLNHPGVDVQIVQVDFTYNAPIAICGYFVNSYNLAVYWITQSLIGFDTIWLAFFPRVDFGKPYFRCCRFSNIFMVSPSLMWMTLPA